MAYGDDPEDYDQPVPDIYLGATTAPNQEFSYGASPPFEGLSPLDVLQDLTPPPTEVPEEGAPSFYTDYFALEQGLIDRNFREDEVTDKGQLLLAAGRGQITPADLTPKGQE